MPLGHRHGRGRLNHDVAFYPPYLRGPYKRAGAMVADALLRWVVYNATSCRNPGARHGVSLLHRWEDDETKKMFFSKVPAAGAAAAEKKLKNFSKIFLGNFLKLL